jgi:hypothetical protein
MADEVVGDRVQLGGEMPWQREMTLQDFKKARIGFGKPKPNRVRHAPPHQAKPPEFEREAQDQSERAHENGIFSWKASHQNELGKRSCEREFIALGSIRMKCVHSNSPQVCGVGRSADDGSTPKTKEAHEEAGGGKRDGDTK